MQYKCAVERKIPILKPSWILDTFDIWQRGDDFDAENVRFIPTLRSLFLPDVSLRKSKSTAFPPFPE